MERRTNIDYNDTVVRERPIVGGLLFESNGRVITPGESGPIHGEVAINTRRGGKNKAKIRR